MNIIYAIISIIIAQSAGIIGSFFTSSGIKGWYTTLVKPALNPPSWVFGPVWITLYTLMGIASYLVWQRIDVPGAKIGLAFYGLQLILNALWSIIFFGFKQPGFAFGEIMVLFVCIVITTVLFWKVSSLAGACMLPYIVWVGFAVYLNFSIWRLN